MPKIFISYRRDDSGGWAGRLHDRLSQQFGRDNIFVDINTIEPGLGFAEVIQEAVTSCVSPGMTLWTIIVGLQR
jgi:hypothetical protein